MTTLAFRSRPTVYSGHIGTAAAPPPRRETLAIVSTRSKLCGIAAYTAALRRQLSEAFDVTVFDLKTLAVITKVKTGQNPDAIIYEPVSKRVFTFNGKSSDSTAFDAKTGNVITASIPLGGKPEFAQVDGKGHVFANIEDKNEVIEIDAKQLSSGCP